MLRIREYRRAESLEEAYELNQKKTNHILAGGVWTKMGDRNWMCAIDLSGLGLDKIEETDEEFIIGCMVTLRDFETHPGLNAYTKGAAKRVSVTLWECVCNCATIGGSLFGRFGFSDVLTLFLALDSYVELYKAGTVSMKKFAAMPYDNDILMSVHVKKTPIAISCLSVRNSATDFPVLATAVSEYDGRLHISIGARPVKAEVLELPLSEKDDLLQLADKVRDSFTFGSNRRAGADYRRHVAGVLVQRACQANGKQMEETK